MVNPEEILQKIEEQIPSSPPAPARSNTAESIRDILSALVQWVVENDYTPQHEWDGTKIRFVRADGVPGQWIDLKGRIGDIPAHSWEGTVLRFQNPDGTTGNPVNLQGPGGKGLAWKNAWQPNTQYYENDGVEYGGSSYRAKSDFVSGSAFNAVNWSLIAQGGTTADGTVTLAKLEYYISALVSFLSQTVEQGNQPFRVSDQNGNLGAELTQDGLFRLLKLFVHYGISAGSVTASQVNGVEFENHPDFFELLTDSLGNVAHSVDMKGRQKTREITTLELKLSDKVSLRSDGSGGMVFKNLLTNQDIFAISPTGGIELNDLKVFVSSEEQFPFAYTDAAGNVANGYDRKGNPLLGGSTTTAKGPLGIVADVYINALISQSLGLGAYGSPAFTATPEPYLLQFTKGPRMMEFDNDSTRFSGLVPLVETGNSGNLETPCSSYARAFKKALAADGFVMNDTNQRLEMISFASGTSGVTITDLSKGSVGYQRFVDCLNAAKNLTKAQGKTMNLPLIYWMQGEHNVNDSQSSYKAKILQLKKDLIAEVKAINPTQKNELVFLTYQLAFHNAANPNSTPSGAYPNIALAFLDLALTEPGFYLGPVMYPYVYADNIHLSGPFEYMKVGALAGYIAEQIIMKGDFKPIHVKDYLYEGNILTLRFHVPVAPLVFDTETVTDPGNKGFRLFSGSTEQTITSVEITRPDTVKIVCVNPVLAGMKLTYAINGTPLKSGRTEGSRGCLRDSQGNTVKFEPTGYSFRLDNWCPIFEKYL
ncbi:hypothetical protein [Siphonobacter sp. SORGH_AS_0500]|uniref:hypothetical protein n=1 Tax=Siphonobacter sp. SORGH_AS_0500 TaxID=1864824 RepID=UPI0028608492|nr:hypothetical protein [Siphonobacter sp. SORGH_AS_0500]MDR6195189.1 hypothetical protein [Siphonobacter sp. SORGH_AS_0500]